jgi:hypothetical protein
MNKVLIASGIVLVLGSLGFAWYLLSTIREN